MAERKVINNVKTRVMMLCPFCKTIQKEGTICPNCKFLVKKQDQPSQPNNSQE
jgi:uncharacterized Zn finger protein (UPF0148 family)